MTHFETDTTNDLPADRASPRVSVRGRRFFGVIASIVVPPGIGHLLLGAWKRAALWFLAYVIAVVLSPFSFWVFTMIYGVRFAAAVDVVAVRAIPAKPPRLAFALAAVGGASLVALVFGAVIRSHYTTSFVVPTNSMAPGLFYGDHFVVKRFDVAGSRGDVVAFVDPCSGKRIYVERVVATAGDSVEIRCSTLYVNGEAVPREAVPGECNYYTPASSQRSAQTAQCLRYRESLDGVTYDVFEPQSLVEQIADAKANGTGLPSDFPGHELPRCSDSRQSSMRTEPIGAVVPSGDGKGCELHRKFVVPSGQIFVLGDNRGDSADSRVWGPVPVENVVGTAAFIWWANSKNGNRWQRIGTTVR